MAGGEGLDQSSKFWNFPTQFGTFLEPVWNPDQKILELSRGLEKWGGETQKSSLVERGIIPCLEGITPVLRQNYNSIG